MSKDRYPGATWAPLPESGEHGRYTKTQLIYHSTGTRASAAANYRYFRRGDVPVESTLIVDYDGGALQVMEAYEKADANMSASRRSISVEVVGLASEPYTPQQVERCIDIGRWALAHHPIAPRQCPAHDASGIGWHVMFGAPGPWTAVRGKECPGGQRIAQVRDLIIPALTAPPKPPAPPTLTEDPDMRVAYRPDGLAVLVAGGRIYPLTGGEVNAHRAIGTPVKPVTDEQFDALERLSEFVRTGVR